MVNEIAPRSSLPEQVTASEVLKNTYDHVVIMPYSQNLRENGNQRLTFYSSFAINASVELYKEGKVKKFILCGEDTFGKDMKSTSQLQKESMIRLGIPEEDIIVLEKPNLDNTAIQIQAVADFQREKGLQEKKFLVIDWRFHDERVRNHIKGFGLNAQTVQAEDLHKLLQPKFNLEKMEEVLPSEFEAREKMLRKISRYDTKGLVPKALTAIRGGSVTDIQHVRDENGHHLAFENTTGKKKRAEIPQRFDATIIPGENIRKFLGVGYDRDYIRGRRDHLSIWSKQQAIAAGELDRRGITGTLIFSTGKTAGEDIPSEAEAMLTYAKRHFSKLQKRPILEEKSFDTSTNAEELATIIKRRKFKNIAVVVPEMHEERFEKELRFYLDQLGLTDVSLTMITSESVLKERSSHHRKYINRLSFSPQRLTQDAQEAVAAIVSLGDPGGLRLRKRAEKERLKNQS